jgi:uroporphyrinogen decarboxylase
MTGRERILAACRTEPVDRTPVWLMRQAGRYLPEYRKVREKHDILEICKHPDLAAEVTLQPLRRFDLDAAIIFSDLLLPLEPMGIPIRFAKGEGPVIERPIRSAEDVAALRPLDPGRDLQHVLRAIGIVRGEIGDRNALIGFAGAPFTLASYAIEGGASRDFLRTKRTMWEDPATWDGLLGGIAAAVRDFLIAQVEAGADVVQVFDSWAGCLSREDYETRVMPHTRTVIDGLEGKGAPVIHFGTGTAAFLDRMREAGGDVIGVDWRVPLDAAWERIGADVGIQGNLDPGALFAPREVLLEKVDAILDRAGGRPGHIFNLGHGVLPDTPIDAVETVVDRVHARRAAAP